MLFSLLTLAFADTSDDDAALTVIVKDAKNLTRARAELDEAIRDLGYLPGVGVGDRTFYMPIKPWKPKVTFHEEGRVRVKARAVTPLMVGPARSPACGARRAWPATWRAGSCRRSTPCSTPTSSRSRRWGRPTGAKP
ncbi:MAG: hypothetical protein GY913_05425 [Proteobacteria bacterium]|nr:hypothetical protein [Pseudomonadota bacterium]